MKVMRGAEIKKDGGTYSQLQVLQSAAGYFIGRLFVEDGTGMLDMGSRESDYFPSHYAAEKALTSGEYEARAAAENLALYE